MNLGFDTRELEWYLVLNGKTEVDFKEWVKS